MKHAHERDGTDDGKASEREGKASMHFTLGGPPRLLTRSGIVVIRSRVDRQWSGMYQARYKW